MNKAEKVQFVIDTLQEKYPEIPIPLDHKDPYTLLIAVLLSAQCTDVRVNKITPLLFAKADNPFDMVKMTVEEIKEIIRPCGLSPMKSKGIYGLSKILIDKLPAFKTAFHTMLRLITVTMAVSFALPYLYHFIMETKKNSSLEIFPFNLLSFSMSCN